MDGTDSRYPYTYAADYLRAMIGYVDEGTVLSRSDASRIFEVISGALGIEKEDLAKKLADIYIKDDLSQEIVNNHTKEPK